MNELKATRPTESLIKWIGQSRGQCTTTGDTNNEMVDGYHGPGSMMLRIDFLGVRIDNWVMRQARRRGVQFS